MRSESERAYQDGGMVNEIIERSTDPTPGENLSQMIIKNRDDAMARLRAGQDAIAQRRAQQQQRDESSKWLALAEGMLSPTRTGSFGESIGQTAGLMRQEQEIARGHEGERIQEEMLLAQQEGDIQEDYIDQLQAQARIDASGYSGEYSRTRPIGTDKLYPHPEDPTRLARGQQIWDPDIEVPKFNDDGTPMLDENGEQVVSLGDTRIQWLETRGPDGSIPFAASPLEVERTRQLEMARGLAAAEVTRISNDIQGGRDAFPMIRKYEDTMALMRQVEREGRGTGGYVALLQGMAEWFGVNTEEVTQMGALRNRLGQAVLEGLKHFPGQISEGERIYMESLESGLGKPLGVNMELLEEGLRIQRERYVRGLIAARHIGSDFDLRQMGVDPDAPPGTPSAGSQEGARQNLPGSTQANPLDTVPGGAAPPAGTWIRLPDGSVRKYPGLPEGELPPEGLILNLNELNLTQAPAASPGG